MLLSSSRGTQLRQAQLTVYGESTNFATSAGANNESYTYDLNGNIKSLARYRKGTGLIDNLTYTYKNNNISNLLDKVEDASGTNGFNNGINTTNEYSFDGNGNLTTDLNKGYTSILYNYLNLPKRVGTATAGQYISYIYDAAGTKLAKVSTTGAYTYYAGNFVYSGSSLNYIIHQEGHVEPGGAYKYYLKDHLGSVRMVVNTTGTGGTIEQQTDYYPFGMTIAEYNGSVIDYRYNGKELHDDLINGKKLDWYDYGARFYDPQIGRFTTVDPAAELGRRWSPYTYTFDNPMRFTDPDGMWPDGGPGDDPFFAARFVRTVMQDLTIGVYNTITWLGSMAQPVYNPVRSIATKVQGDDGYYYVDKTIAIETPGQRLAGVLDPIGVIGTFSGGGPAAFMAKSAPGTSITQSIKSLRNSAVTKAWKQEQNLLKETGEGTRQWTKAEKAQLMEEGKVDGYVGHHINNVKDHPEMAGNPDNVGFVRAGKKSIFQRTTATIKIRQPEI